MAAANGPAEADSAVSDTVIVTGTRSEGRTARQSATPIDVIGAEDLAATGQTNLLDALKSVTPSLATPAVGYDVGALARTFQLRGLSPSHTLVLVNGKRRHLSASLYADEDPAQGSNAVDLDMIPLNAIDHVEILKDGAAAQYGSDAIAGVINVILKNADHGTSAFAETGGYFDGGGATGQVGADSGVRLPAGGTLHLSAGLRVHDFSNRSGDSGGPPPAKVQGAPQSGLGTLGFDVEQPVAPDVTAYGFGTMGRRIAKSWENPRQPGATGVAAVDALYPAGFSPQETIDELDFSLHAGLKGRTSGAWKWDVSAGYGRDSADLHNRDTVNPNLLADWANAQRSFSVGGFTASETVGAIDLQRPVAIAGLAAPLTVSLGFEDRYETYRITPGEANSYYGGGSPASPGFRPPPPPDAGRNGVAGYLDFDTRVTPDWQVGVAGRVEHYDSVGDSETGKISTRYDLSPSFAVRGSVSNGFHAPTLAQQYYSATSVSTGFASIQLPIGSAGARSLGAPDLKPETSRSQSVGIVAEPLPGLHATVDAYRIRVDNRIINTGYIYGPLALQAIAANGSAIPAGLDPGNVGAQFYTNGVDTRTRGIDVSLDTRSDLGDLGAIKWVLAGGYNDTRITRVHDAPAALKAAGIALVDPIQASNLTSATPRVRGSLAATWLSDRWEVTLRQNFYSHTTQVQNYATALYYRYQTTTATTTDLDVGYAVTDNAKVSIGANNLFNIYPNKIPAPIYRNVNFDQYSHLSPYGINGGFYYARLGLSF
ncbi:MAG: TonB-dependent receptor [Telmatospirillum sp.]|nr:TonB-dependent receptor [Telmatospirillum sp.]